MIRLPPRSTRTDTLFPYTTLFRSPRVGDGEIAADLHRGAQPAPPRPRREQPHRRIGRALGVLRIARVKPVQRRNRPRPVAAAPKLHGADRDAGVVSHVGATSRSEERPVGKGCVSTVRSWWLPYQ